MLGLAARAAEPQGPIPTGLPPRLLVGVHEEPGETWMRDSNVPWDVRYRVLRKGWTGDEDSVPGFLRESREQGVLPALVFDQLEGEPGGGDSALYAKTQNATIARVYFGDFLRLMQRAREFGRPVLVIIEPNGTGLLQEQTRSDPQAFAAVRASGLEELARLPDTVAGWGQAFLALRQVAKADNVVLALHVSSWASGEDLTYEAVTSPLQPEVEEVVRFLAPLGLGRNPTGQTYDLLASSPLEQDSDYYRTERRAKEGWDPDDEASVESRSLNRYVEWLRLLNHRSGKRWVLWHLPAGDSEQLRPPRGDQRTRYRDYFFAEGGEAHRARFVEAGVLALLFGRPAGAAASAGVYATQLRELKASAQPFLEAGGLELPGDTPAPKPPTAERSRPVRASEREEEPADAPAASGGAQRAPPPAPTAKPPAPAPPPAATRAPAPPPRQAPAQPAPAHAAPRPPPTQPPAPAATARPAPRDAGTAPRPAPAAGAAPTRPAAPALVATTRVTRRQVTPGAVSTVSTTLRNDGAAVGGLFVELEIFDAASRRVAQQTWADQRLGAGESATFAWPWRAPAAPGTYRVRVGLFGPQGSPRYLSHPEAALVTVEAQAPGAAPSAAAPPGAAAVAPSGAAAVALSVRGDGAQYAFETDTQGWRARGPSAEAPTVSGLRAYAGTRSLAVRFNGASGTTSVHVPTPPVPPGRTVTFHVWVPQGAGLDSLQAYVQEGEAGRYRFTGTWRALGSLTPDAWNTLEVAVPANATRPLLELGVELRASGGWRGTVHVDAVRW